MKKFNQGIRIITNKYSSDIPACEIDEQERSRDDEFTESDEEIDYFTRMKVISYIWLFYYNDYQIKLLFTGKCKGLGNG